MDRTVAAKQISKDRGVSLDEEEDEDEEEDMSDGELMEMFTEIFSIILLKKRKKYLKLKHHDKHASLPHPSSLLLKNPQKARKREFKKQMKLEHQRQLRQHTGETEQQHGGKDPENNVMMCE